MASRTSNGQEELEDASARTGAVQIALGCGLIGIDKDRRIMAFDADAARLSGLTSVQVLGKECDILGEGVHRIIKESLACRTGVSQRQVPAPALRDRSLAVSTWVPEVRRGGDLAILVIVQDLTHALMLEASIRRLNRLASLGTLSASTAHEIKNALVAIKTFVETMQKGGEHTELSDIVSREVERINSIVGQVLKFSATRPSQSSNLHLHEAIDQALKLVQHQFVEKQIDVHRDFAAPSDSVSGDIYQLEQAFINLFLNALAAMEPRGALTVGTSVPRDRLLADATELDPARNWVCVTVVDTGGGIPPEALKCLFEPFYTTKPDGTGLGLSITRRIVHEHGGFITVESELNRGAQFTIALPLLAPAEPQKK